MSTASSAKTLLQRETDIMSAAQAASKQLAKVEGEAAARTKAVADAYAKRRAEIDEIEKSAQAALAGGRSTLSRAQVDHLLPNTTSAGQWVARSGDPRTEGTIREAQSAASELKTLADKLDVVRANKRRSVPGWGIFFSVLNFAASVIAFFSGMGMFSSAGEAYNPGSYVASGFLLVGLAGVFAVTGYGLAQKADWARWLTVIELVCCGFIIIPLFFIPPLFNSDMKRAYTADKNDGRLLSGMSAAAFRLARAVGATNAWVSSAQADAASTRDRNTAATDQQNAQALAQARQVYAATLAALRQQISELSRDAGLQGIPWSDNGS